MAAHGGQKLFGWFGGPGLQGTAGFMEMFGFRPGLPFALAVSLGEIASGLLMAFGLFGPVGPALMILVMIVALVVAHLGKGYFAMTNGIEFPLVYAAAALALASSGPGALSLDRLLGLDGIWNAERIAATLVLGVAGAAITLMVRRRSEAPAPALATK
jgi:putative oxidoreductase